MCALGHGNLCNLYARGTLCVSSQVGCTLNCSFCHTGTQRLVRNLTAGEIVGQVMVARDRLNDWVDRETPNGNRLVTNIVMMGMGQAKATAYKLLHIANKGYLLGT